jgi:prepilin-type N-terminal cleavage/methylation domain-containing protein
MDGRTDRQRGAGGFTLVEVLASVAILALIGVAVTAISLAGIVQIRDGAQERGREATTAQWASVAFARDVQGAAAVVAECAPGRGDHLVTVQASDDASQVEYRRVSTADGYQLLRVECGGGSRVVVKELASPPEVRCEAADGSVGPCQPATAPRRISLDISSSSSFSFALDASRRLTDGNSSGPPLEVPDFVSLGGDTPLEAGGTSRLEVIGNAFINRPPDTEVAVDLRGTSQLEVSGAFELQQGAVCSGCPSRANKLPGTYQTRLLDPLRFLPAPETTGLTTQTDCPVQGGVRVCQPGIYPDEFPPAAGGGGGGGGVKDYQLQPGLYVLRDGIKVNNGSLTGTGVLLYNEAGNVKITGAALDLLPATSGAYSGILFFQARSNSAAFEIVGNAALASITGTIYAPASTDVVLGGGGGDLRVGRVIGQNLQVSGAGTVIVDGS